MSEKMREAARQADALICSARLCEVNSMSSRQEMLRLLIEATDVLRAALAEPVCCCGEPSALGIVHRTDGPCYTAESETVQEPVAWMTHGNDLLPLFHKTKAGALAWGAEPLPLYTAPPKRPPLTDEEIDALKGEVWGSSGIAPRSASAFARAVERKVRGEEK